MAQILVVDDDAAVAELLAEFVRLRGHDARIAGSGLEALELARQARFDVIFLDITMPGMNGIETLRQLRDEFPATKVIVVSGVSDERTAVLSMDLGATDYIGKPFDLDHIDRILSLSLAVGA